MKNILLSISVSLFLMSLSCKKIPVTGRRQLHILPEKYLTGMASSQYSQFLTENKPMQATDNNVTVVQTVGKKIAAAATAYLKQHGMANRVAGFKWEFNVVNDATINAWCMPGGKVVFYTGILPITQNENGIAVVMGHEIAHAIARHGNERMSQQIPLQVGTTGLDLFLATKGATPQFRQIMSQSIGVVANVGAILPFSRLHESEADKMGLVFSALAGYDPREAVPFWQRMAAQGGQKPPVFLSTHPEDNKRIKDLQDFMPQALKYYRPTTVK